MASVAERHRKGPPARSSRPSARPPQAGRGWGQPLDPFTQEAMESRFGHDFGRVRIHTGPEAARSAEGLGAHAYTLGLDVHFGEGRYRPDLPEGQALIAHELEHVARAGARGPDVPKLQPKPDVDHEENLRKILVPGQAPKLRQYLEAHPASLEVAEDLLLQKIPGKDALLPLLQVMFSKDPKSQGRVVLKLGRRDHGIANKAFDKSHEMWRNYEDAAYEHALMEWCKKKLKEKKDSRDVQLRIETWRQEAETRYKELAKKRPALLAESDAGIRAMMAAAEPIPYAHGDMLETLSNYFHNAINDARRNRVQTYEAWTLLNLKASPDVEKKLATSREGLEKAQQEEERAGEKRASLGSPAPGASETREQKKAREAESGARARSQAAEKALTPEGAGDPAVKEYLRSQDPAVRKQADRRLDIARGLRDARIPEAMRQPVGREVPLVEEDRWWIYHKALSNIATGFDSFIMEASVKELAVQRSRIVKDPRALGLDQQQTGIGTYEKHGEGAFDVYAQAGEIIKAALPATVDLARVLGAIQPRMFRHESTTVKWAAPMPANADDEVLAKLIPGYFGFWASKPIEMEKFLKGEKTDLKPSPDVNRLVAALTFQNALAGTFPTGDLQDNVKLLREELESAVREELSKLPTPVVIPKDVRILNDVDASQGHLANSRKITDEAFGYFQKVNPGNWQYKKDTAATEVFKAIRRITVADNTFSATLKAVLGSLPKQRVNEHRGGLGVTLLHKYREAASRQEAWIAVDYFHLHDVKVQTGQSVTAGMVIAKAGSSGNADSPHIHMGIRVYDQEPKGKVVPIGHLHPLDYFPFGRKGK